MINIATVGTSYITETFISALNLSKRFNLYACYSRDEKRAADFKEKHGFEKCSCNLNEMANDPKLDAVYIATPNYCHFNQSMLFLKKGKHVICEKPAVTESRQFEILTETAKENGVIFTEAIMSCNSDDGKLLKDAISQIGKTTLARIDFSQRSSRYDRYLAGEHINIFDMSLGAGALTDIGIYCVYAAVDLFGIPETISSNAYIDEKGADLSGVTVFGYNGFNAVLTYGKNADTAIGSEVLGDAGTVKIGFAARYTDISIIKNGCEKAINGSKEHHEVMVFEAINFADYIEHFEQNEQKYQYYLTLGMNVHKCMDIIKAKSGIKYNLKECLI